MGPVIILDLGVEDWLSIIVEYNEKNNEVGDVAVVIPKRVLRGNVELERVSEAVVQEFVVGPIVTVFERRAWSKMVSKPEG